MNTDKLIELLMEHGFNSVDSDEYMTGLIAMSNACGWAPDVVEDPELSKINKNEYRFSATICYCNDGGYKSDVVALYEKVEETITGKVTKDGNRWFLENLNSEYKTFGIMGDDQEHDDYF